ncbi:MAG: RluA family pseudouridine synthase [Oscillospiraceae bacterium]|nr:RluA family pseudouridine synthase [Oscillospiraceae bacterium]
MKLTVDAERAGTRLDAFLAAVGAAPTRSAAAALVEKGFARSPDGAVLKKNRVLAEGEEIDFTPPEPAPAKPEPKDIPLDVVFEDADVIVVNKPKGLVVHPAPGHADDTLVNALLHHCGSSLSGVGGELRPGVVHRLDMDTSGLIIAAKNDRAHLSLSAQLADRTLSRKYEAVVIGHLRSPDLTVSAPIGRSPSDRKKMAVTEKNSRPAVTHFFTLEEFPGYAHLRCVLETGRTHQIRVHAAHIGHPVLGDAVYGGAREGFGLTSQCLHARELSFTHPATGERITLTSPLPDYFEAVLAKLRRL